MSTTCPKCGATLRGPSYDAGTGGVDWLIYRCTCGYEERRPPKDRAQPDGEDIARRMLGSKWGPS